MIISLSLSLFFLNAIAHTMMGKNIEFYYRSSQLLLIIIVLCSLLKKEVALTAETVQHSLEDTGNVEVRNYFCFRMFC